MNELFIAIWEAPKEDVAMWLIAVGVVWFIWSC